MKMWEKFDREVKSQYKNEQLKVICSANLKLVPEFIITSIKSALSLEVFPADKDACHHFLGWDIATFELRKRDGIPLNILFNEMKGTFQPTCATKCNYPNEHFIEYSNENKCFPIEKVFEVLMKISVNAANKLLDISLVEEVCKQIRQNHCERNLKIFSLDPNPQPFNPFRLIGRRDFNVLIINYENLKMSEPHEPLELPSMEPENYSLYVENLMNNIQNNFSHNLLTKPTVENNLIWEEQLNKALKKANLIVSILSDRILENIKTWKNNDLLNGMGSNTSLNSTNSSQSFNTVDNSNKYQYFVWKKISKSDKVKIGVIFNRNLMTADLKCFPIAFVLPLEMSKLIFFINEMKKAQ